MAILNLTDLHHFGRPPFFLAFLLLFSFWGLPGIGIFYRYGCINVMQYAVVCRIDGTTATQLLINTTSFPLSWTLEPRDIGIPSAQEGERGTDLRTGRGQRPEERFSFIQVPPWAVTGGLSAARFFAEPLMEVTTSWVGARWLQVQFLVSLFPRLCGGARPHHCG